MTILTGDQMDNLKHGDGHLIEQAEFLGLTAELATYRSKRWATGREAVEAVGKLRAAIAAAKARPFHRWADGLEPGAPAGLFTA